MIENTFDFVLYILSMSIGLGFVYFVSKIMLDESKSKTLIRIYWFVVATSTYSWYIVSKESTSILFLFLSAVLIIGVFKGKLLSKCLTLLIVVLSSYLFEMILLLTFSLYNQSGFTIIIKTNFRLYDSIVSALQIIVVVIYYWLVKASMLPAKLRIDEISAGSQISMIAITSLLMGFIIRINSSFKSLETLTHSLTTSFLTLTLLMSTIIATGIVLMIGKNIRERYLSRSNLLLKNQIESQLNHYNQLEKVLVETRKIKHDMTNHLICLRHLLDTNDYHSAINYLDQVEQRIHSISSIIETGNTIVDAILNEKISIASTIECDIHFHGYVPGSTFIELTDLCTIIANTLDNALEATDRYEGDHTRTIEIISRVEYGLWLYKIINPSNYVLLSDRKMPLSQKADQYAHGHGLNNVKESVERYSGDLKLSYDNHTFSLTIALPLKDHTP